MRTQTTLKKRVSVLVPQDNDEMQHASPVSAPVSMHLKERTDPRTIAAWMLDYQRDRSPAQRDRIAEAHEWLVILCANRLRRRGELFEDLAQVARIGLLDAIERFKPQYGVEFRTFASATILGMLRRHYRSTWRLHVPRRLQELHVALSDATEVLTGSLQRPPTAVEIAAYLHVAEQDVIEAMGAADNFVPLSLSSIISSPDSGFNLEQVLGEHDPGVEIADERTELREVLAQLPSRERAILYLRFFEDRTQSEIGEHLGLSQVHVSRLMRSALETLRAHQRSDSGESAGADSRASSRATRHN